MGLMIITPVKRRRHGKYDDPKDSRRQVTVCFSIPDGTGNIIQVCKKLFMEVFGITKRRVETLVLKKKKGEMYILKLVVIRRICASLLMQIKTL